MCGFWPEDSLAIYSARALAATGRFRPLIGARSYVMPCIYSCHYLVDHRWHTMPSQELGSLHHLNFHLFNKSLFSFFLSQFRDGTGKYATVDGLCCGREGGIFQPPESHNHNQSFYPCEQRSFQPPRPYNQPFHPAERRQCHLLRVVLLQTPWRSRNVAYTIGGARRSRKTEEPPRTLGK